jgi:hypothetical protein
VGAEEAPSIQDVVMSVNGASPSHLVRRGDEIVVAVTARNPGQVPIHVGVAIHRADGVYCFGTNTFHAGPPPKGEQLAAAVRFPNFGLQRGSYYLVVGLFGEKVDTLYEMRYQAYEFQVSQDDDYEGVVFLPHEWRLD